MFSRNNKPWLRNIVALVAVSLILAAFPSIADAEYVQWTQATLDNMTSDTQITAVSASDTRTTIGLKEKVDCSINPATWSDLDCKIGTGIVADTIGTRTWSAIGSGGTVSPTSGNSTVLTADDDPGSVIVKVTVLDSRTKYDDTVVKTKAFTVIAPSYETVDFDSWSSTIIRWKQQLMPTTVSFGNIIVYEYDVDVGSDACWFTGSDFDPFTSVSGTGGVPVGNDNRWEPDLCGWDFLAVAYYRTYPTGNPSAPCGTNLYQGMYVYQGQQNPEDGLLYDSHGLYHYIGLTTVEEWKDSENESKTWP